MAETFTLLGVNTPGGVLGDDAGRGTVSHYVAPGRAEELSGIPPAYIDAGSGEPFRDEGIAYAMKLWKCGVQANLHIGVEGATRFDLFFPTEIGEQAANTRNAWLKRVLRAHGVYRSVDV